MSKIINIYNSVNSGRMAIVTCGLHFDKGELTSTNQILTELGAIGYPLYGGVPYRQRVKWEPFGVRHSDNSIRYARVQFRTEIDPNSEKSCTVSVHNSDYTGYRVFNFDNANYNIFSQVEFQLRINGQTAVIRGSQLSNIDTTDDAGCVRRYKIFTRPFSSMPWIWVELVVDIPNPGAVDAQGNTWTSAPIRHAEFWLRLGCSFAQRGLGQTYGPYNEAQSRFNFSEGINLDIVGCDSAFRFESSELYGKTNVGTGTTRAQRYFLHDHTNGYFNAGQMKMGTSKNWKGVLLLGPEHWMFYPERTSEISAVARGWGPHMPPVFENIDPPPNVAAPSDPNHRTDWKTRINNLVNSAGFGNLGSRPHNATPYGPKPDISGPGDQGLFGCAYHHAPLYHIILSAYPLELPYIVRAMRLNGFRPNFIYEADGNKWRLANYPASWIWNTEIFNGNGNIGGASPDFAGVLWMGYGSQAQKSNDAGAVRNWDSPDRQHCSMQLFAVAAIMTADYFALEFCDMYAEFIGAGVSGVIGQGIRNDVTNVINSWEADRASARVLETLIPMYYATDNSVARIGIIRRYWEGYLKLTSWRFGRAPSIDKLEFMDCKNSWAGSTVSWNPPVGVAWPAVQSSWMPGDLFSLYAGETPFMYPWQLSFVASSWFLVSKMFKDLYPNGAYMTIGNTLAQSTITLQDPGGNRAIISESIAKNIARDVAATVILHCTWKFGPGGASVNIDGDGVGKELYFISMNVTKGPTDTHVTQERVNYCFPLGGIIRGETSGTQARILVVQGADPWQLNPNNGDYRDTLNGKLYLEKISGPGFINDGSYILENLNSITNNYRSTEYYQNGFGAFLNAGWYGMPSYCVDAGGTSNGSAGLGANYRKPLTWTQMLAVDSRRRWNGYTLGGWNYTQFYRDYGIWHAAAVTIVLDGLKNNYYTTADAARFPVSRLQAKANVIRDDMIALASNSSNIWDLTIWPFFAIKADWRNIGYIDITTNNIFIARSIVPAPSITAQRIVTNVRNPQEVTGRTQIPTAVLIVVNPINVIIPVLGSINARGFPNNRTDDLAPRITLDFGAQADAISSSTDIPESGVLAVRAPSGPIINVVINLSMDAPTRIPPVTVFPEILVAPEDYPLPTEEENPFYDPIDPSTVILPRRIIYSTVFTPDIGIPS